VPQRGGSEEQWIDVRPRKRKALRQVAQGQDRFQEEEDRLRVKDDLKLRQSRVRYASREDCYYRDFDTDADYTDSRPNKWGGIATMKRTTLKIIQIGSTAMTGVSKKETGCL